MSRIDIAINERGTQTVTQELENLVKTVGALSPKAAMSLRGQALRIGVNTDKLVKEVAVAALDRVVHATPHDTGQARANWQVNVSNSLPNVPQLLGKTDYEGDQTVAAGEAQIRTTPRAPGESIYISNSLDYIEALNNGWSKQAAAGFVELAVQVGAKIASDATILKRGG